MAPDGSIMSVAVPSGSTFSAGTPQVVLNGQDYFVAPNGWSYDVSPDGSRFLMIETPRIDSVDGSGMVVVLNWAEELKRLVP
jgi:hypothetical protein